mmetsp:Transcript_23555/g.93364  ORF Transcript_23555/g.93364 Transcript_23555/m.93364 type:complete len:335 (-) Transcript_23555:41-1045(-)
MICPHMLRIESRHRDVHLSIRDGREDVATRGCTMTPTIGSPTPRNASYNMTLVLAVRLAGPRRDEASEGAGEPATSGARMRATGLRILLGALVGARRERVVRAGPGKHAGSARARAAAAAEDAQEVELARDVEGEDRRGDEGDLEEVEGRERLGLEHRAQRRPVDDGELAEERAANGDAERPVREEPEPRRADDRRVRPARERVAHVEQHEGRERHRRRARRRARERRPVLTATRSCGGARGGWWPVADRVASKQSAVGVVELVDEDGERAGADEHRRGDDADEDAVGDDGLGARARRAARDGGVDGFDAERLRGRAVHDDVDPEDLHGVERRR